MLKKWELKTVDCAVVDNLVKQLALNPITATILAGRNLITVAEASSFLSPSFSQMLDPQLLKGVDKAVARLVAAKHNQENICIYGDYDVDGISGTALLVSFLNAVGFSCRYFIPNRFDDGYGLNEDSLKLIIEQGATLIVSVDCGITAIEEATFCTENAVDLIILDHHAPKEKIPDAKAVVNPLQPGCGYPFKLLSGVGVAFNLLVALRKALRDEGEFNDKQEPDLRDWLGLVALGTIADVVPLTGQNRIIVYHGLLQLSKSTKPGIKALKQVAGVKENVSCGEVGFRLAPRLNAVGRMESAVPGIDLLLSNSVEQSLQIATELDIANAERQAVEKRILDEAIKMVDSSGRYPACRSIVLASKTWHQGVVGIVASRIVERYHRPAILMAIDQTGYCKGSGRSIKTFHLLDAINSSSSALERFGGHRYAAGVSLKEENLASFAEAFEAEAARILSDEDLLPRLEVDAEVLTADITQELLQDLKRLEPFGSGNPEPLLLLRGMKVAERRTVGEGHLRLQLTKDGRSFNAIGFRLASKETTEMVDIVCIPEINEWNGKSSLQLKIKDIRTAE